MIPIGTITRNSSHIFGKFIKSYERFVDREKHPLWVFDNASREGDREYLRSYFKQQRIDYSWQSKANMLFTHAANEQIRHAAATKADQILLVNPDVEFTLNWDEHIEKNDGIMGFVLVKPDNTVEHAGGYGDGDHIDRGKKFKRGMYNEVVEVDWVTFGAVLIHMGVVKKIGLLDEDYVHFGSDREYCRNAREAGFKIYCSPSELIHHYGKSCMPYIWDEIPDHIWAKMVSERRKSGVYFPDNPKDFRHG